ncbi:leucine-rich repeat protein, partial [Tanacetum coccineum]
VKGAAPPCGVKGQCPLRYQGAEPLAGVPLPVGALFSLCFCSQNIDDVLCIKGERQALIEFKLGLIDEADRLIHLRALDGGCQFTSFEVEVANLKQRLKGNLSSSLLHLEQLRHLDLSCNAFRTEVPKFIGSLENIKHLNLSHSEFSGTIPPQLGNLSQLNVLSLGPSFERTSDLNIRWLSSLHQLHHLDLSGVDLSKLNWLEVINTLFYLVDLHLFNCQLIDIHHHVSSLNITSLSLLDLSDNNFNSSLPLWIFSVTSLVSFDLTRCNIHGLIPSSFRNLTSLQVLHVSENDFMNSSLVLEELSNSNLISLDIRSCGVSSLVLDSLHNLTSLLNLDISKNQLTKTLSKSLCNFSNLKEIDMSDNYDSYGTDLIYLLESFLDCKTPALESLVLSSLGLSGHLPNSIGILPGQLPLLEVLFLSYNKLNGSLPDSIGRLSSLKELDLSYNQLDGSLPNSIGKLSNLEYLSFSSNSMTGIVTQTHFAKLLNLKHLYGGDNNLTLRLPHANWIPLFQLQRLNLNSWRLGPQFPLWLQSQNVSYLWNISNTGITSSMPPDSFWRSLPRLLYVDMSHNHIQGTLSSNPETLFSLDLSSNDFSGKIASSL